MADPLSIVSGIVAVLQGADSLFDLLKKANRAYWAASDEVLALVNEISDIRLILNEHNNIVEQLNHISEEPRIRLNQLLDETKKKILQIEILIQSIFTRPKDLNETEISKFSWVRKKSQVDKLRRELKDLRQSIAEHFAVINLRSQSRIGIQINQITVDTSEVRSRQHQSEIRTAEQFTTVFNNQEQMIRRVDDAETNVLNLITTGNQEQRTAQLQIEERLEDTEGMVLHMLNSQQAMQHTQRMMHDLMLEMSRSSQSRLRFTASNFSSNRCSPTCVCCCHCQKTFQAGSMMGLFGKLFVGYAGIPIAAPPCDSQHCLQRISTVTIIYAFPIWFVARVVFLSFSGDLVPTASLKVVSYLTKSTHDDVIKLVELNNIEGIQKLLTERRISPEPVTASYSIFNYCLSAGKMEVCELLLAAGANPNTPCSVDYKSTMELAMSLQFTRKLPPATVRKIQQLFPNAKDEIAPIPALYRIVLGISQQPITEYLSNYNGPSIFDTTLWGEGILLWALYRKNSSALSALLQYEVDESKRRLLAESVIPLGRCVPCINILRANGANINTLSTIGRSAIFNAINDGSPYDFIVKLLEFGADPNSYSLSFDQSLLMHCCFKDNTDLAALLIKYGADVNFITPKKKVAWKFAVWLNAHKCLKLFLQHGLDLSTKHGPSRHTVLHTAAEDADMETMEILADSRIRGVDVDDMDADGKTAREYLRSRKDYSPELHEAFEALVFSIQPKEVGANVETQHAVTMPGAWIEVEQPLVETSEDGVENPKYLQSSPVVVEGNLEREPAVVDNSREDEEEIFEDAVEHHN